MQYLKKEDYDYIKSKYYSKHMDTTTGDEESEAILNKLGSERFTRVDEIFEENSGLPSDEIRRLILENDEKLSSLSHPVRKAIALSIVLENTRISCDRRDLFPAINCIDRPLDATVIGKWRNEIMDGVIPDVNKRRVFFCDEGIATIWPDYCHSIPDYERLLSLGYKGLLDVSETARRSKTNTPEQEEFYEGIKLTYEAIIKFINRLAEKAENTEGSEKMAKALRNIASNPPKTFYEAMLTAYIYFMISEHIDGLQVRSLSNFDRIYYPFYKSDLENGLTAKELQSQLAYYLMQFSAIDNYWGQPVYLGGTKADGSTEINELSYIFLELYDNLNLYNPKIQLKVSYKSTPKEFILKALDMIRRGNNSIVFVCEETIVSALMRFGVSYEAARLCQISGCYEYGVIGSFGTGMNYVNLLKPLEYTLHQGRDGVSGNFAGLECKAVSEYTSFDELVSEYKRQLKHIIDGTIEIVNGFEDYLYVINPLSQLSATFAPCIESGKDAIGGGACQNGSGMMFGFIADVADSLAMIKKYVFDKKELTLEELTSALDKNFDGYEMLRRKLLLDPDKYGNNKELPDSIAVDIVNYIDPSVNGRPNAKVRGGIWRAGFHVARQSYSQAPKTASSPNGRLIGEELSKNCSASMGQNREGATAAVLSVTKLPARNFASDLPLDMGLLPSAVQGADGLEAMYGILMTFMKRGGHALHINVFSAEKLRAAQREPEKYRDLQIRVCGWNVLFNNICKKEQDGFIKQAEALV